MKHILPTALEAGAQRICVHSSGQAFPGMGAIVHQPAFSPVSRRDILTAVNICGRVLGLRPAAVIVLDALLSCLPCKDASGQEIPVAPTTLLTIFASNQTLCFRAKGLTDRQLRRHLDTLEKAGLILRRDSANGKRFPVMQHGKAIGAFGLDLSPLFAGADRLLSLARQRQEEAEELRGVRAQVMRLRALCDPLALDETSATFIDGLRNLMRRASLTLIEARAALSHLTAIISGCPAPEEAKSAFAETAHPVSALATRDEPALAQEEKTSGDRPENLKENLSFIASAPNQTSASDGQNVRHKEPESDTKKRSSAPHQISDWSQLTQINSFYPQPDNVHEASTIAFAFGNMLRIGQDLIAKAVHRIGLWQVLRLENEMAGKIETLINPEAYFRSVLRA